MGGRHQHFEDPITQTQDMRKTTFDQGGFFVTLYIEAIHQNFWILTTGSF